MRGALVVASLSLFAGCATDVPDGSCPGGIQRSTCWATATISCAAGSAASGIRQPLLADPCTVCVPATDLSYTASCAGGCAVSVDMQWLPTYAALAHPAILCAETPAAKAGDPCTNQADDCLPTRAQLAADGTVSAQDYLTCSAGACVHAAAPVVAHYLERCGNVDDYAVGTVGVSYGSAGSCLVAWDPARGAMTSGQTIECAGDWACPSGSLCDDQIADARGSATKLGVCKPGPRGVLTAAMLSP